MMSNKDRRIRGKVLFVLKKKHIKEYRKLFRKLKNHTHTI